MNPPVLTLRPARQDDADLLLKLRNDPATRLASLQGHEIQIGEHRAWLAGALADPQRQIFIVEVEGRPVGSLRADLVDGVHRLSWVVAAEARGRGLGKRMVLALVKRVGSPVRAEVKRQNQASAKIAEAAGLRLRREVDGVLYFEKT